MPPDDPLLADKRFCWLPGRAFGDGSLSRQRANRAYLCLFGDLREETQDRPVNFCGKRGIPNAKHGPYLHNELLASGLHRYALSRDGVPVKNTKRRLPREPHRGR